LKWIVLCDTNINQNLNYFSHLKELESLYLRGSGFFGSLKSLSNTRLVNLSVLGSNLNITEGLDFLPNSLKAIEFDNKTLIENFKEIKQKQKDLEFAKLEIELENEDLQKQVDRLKKTDEAFEKVFDDHIKRNSQLQDKLGLLEKEVENWNSSFIKIKRLSNKNTPSELANYTLELRKEKIKLNEKFLSEQSKNEVSNFSFERLKIEKESLENNFKELKQQNQLEISEIKKNCETKLIELKEVVGELANDLLDIKKTELDKLISDYKSKLEDIYHGYLDIFLETSNPTAKKHLLKKFDEKALKELAVKQQVINLLEERVNKIQEQQAQIEVLPLSYNQ
jgi:hypothetical protein